MAISAIGTHRDATKDAITLTVDGTRIALSHDQTADRTEEQITVALGGAATTADVVLPEITVHINRDGSLALATGKLPKGFVWPEDEREDAIDG